MTVVKEKSSNLSIQDHFIIIHLMLQPIALKCTRYLSFLSPDQLGSND